MQAKRIADDNGICHEIHKTVPPKYFLSFFESICELEDNDNHIHHNFPKSRLHLMVGCTITTYRFDIEKISGWRVYTQYGKDGILHMIALSTPSEHDNVSQFVKSHKALFIY